MTLGDEGGLDDPAGAVLADGEPEPDGVGVGVVPAPDLLDDGRGEGVGVALGVRLLVGTGTGITGRVECGAGVGDGAMIAPESAGLTTT